MKTTGKFRPMLLLSAIALLAWNAMAAETVKPVKYVFLFIGDGLSIPQRMSTEEFLRRTENRGLAINAMPVQGTNTTYSASSFITDSAASGTAIACGSKTGNGRLGVDAEGNRCESVAELAKKHGYRIGIISSVGLNHATPAAFYAHDASRANYYDIALELLAADFDFFGGGRIIDEDGKKRKDAETAAANIFDIAREKGFTVVEGKEGLTSLGRAGRFPILAVTARKTGTSLPNAIDRNDSEATLADYVAKAIELLSGAEGFFLMAEGGKIDWLCHANDAAGMLREIIAFDEAVAVALDFARLHPEETLIVVTGDHETGGLTLGFAGTGYSSYLELLANQKISGEEFNRQFKKLKEEKGDRLTFEEVKPLLTAGFGLKFDGDAKDRMTLSDLELEKLKKAFDRAMGSQEYASTENPKVLYGSYPPLTVAALHIIGNKASIGWTTFAHTAMPVGTSAWGVNAELFSGLYDNTDIAKRLKKVLTAGNPE